MAGIPNKFQSLVGETKIYRYGSKKVEGVVQDVRWSSANIARLKYSGKKLTGIGTEYRGVELKIKPSNGTRAIWTKPFNSGVKAINQ